MKYIYGTIVTLTAMLFSLTACTADSPETGKQSQQLIISAAIGSGAQTRTVTTGLQTTQIAVGNTVGAFVYRNGETAPDATAVNGETYGYTNKKFEAVSGTTQLYNPDYTAFPLQGTGTELQVDVYAYAPYHTDGGWTASEWTTPTLTGNKAFSVQTDQSTDANYIASDLLYASLAAQSAGGGSYTTLPLTFSHKLTQVQVTVTYGDGLPAGTLDDTPIQLVNVLTGGTIDLTDGTVTANEPAAVTDRGTVTLFNYLDDDGSGNPVKTGTAIIYPHTAAELTAGGAIQIEVNGFTYTAALKTYDATNNPTGIQQLEAGKKYQYNVTVSSTGITFSAAISPWDSSEPVRPAEAELPD